MDKIERFSTRIYDTIEESLEDVRCWVWNRADDTARWAANHPNTIRLALSLMVIVLFFACWLVGATYKEG